MKVAQLQSQSYFFLSFTKKQPVPLYGMRQDSSIFFFVPDLAWDSLLGELLTQNTIPVMNHILRLLSAHKFVGTDANERAPMVHPIRGWRLFPSSCASPPRPCYDKRNVHLPRPIRGVVEHGHSYYVSTTFEGLNMP